jgi:nucleotide-binding universal stress UspA family protein
MDTIIAATDYSPLAENAAEYAAALAKMAGERLVLLNDFVVTPDAENARIPEHQYQKLLELNKLHLAKKAISLSERYGIEVIPRATSSYVENELRNLISEYEPRVLVLGMAPRSWEQKLWGNTTTEVIKKLHAAVLVVPGGATYKGFRKVLFACDILHGVSEQLLNRIRRLAMLTSAVIEVLIINAAGDGLEVLGTDPSPLKGIDDNFDGIAYNYTQVNADSVIKGIRKEIIRSGAELLIMAPQKHGFWDSFVHRSKTRIMASGLEIPLLALPL